jgi:hypothetical protein
MDVRDFARRGAVGLLAAALVWGCGGDDGGDGDPLASTDDVARISGVEAVAVESAQHVANEVDYPTDPPAGGDHNGALQNCGFYRVPVVNELAVHSLEHGAVWITYEPDADRTVVDAIEELAAQHDYVLASPYPANPAPVVLTAWGRRLELDGPDDERVVEFLELYLEDGPTTPEPGAPCSGAVGVPPDQPTTLVR